MDQHTVQMLHKLNQAIIKFRGAYSTWASGQGITYNEMLVLYTLREQGFCIQKQICDNYCIPRQTINHVITVLRGAGYLRFSPEHSQGREKAFVLTEQGRAYAAPFLASLEQTESRAVALLGLEKLSLLTQLMLEYDQALTRALEDAGSGA